MPHSQRPLFSRPHQAFLFDMDGTLLNSIAVVERIWADWAVAHGLEPEVFLKTVHGIRAADVIADLALHFELALGFQPALITLGHDGGKLRQDL